MGGGGPGVSRGVSLRISLVSASEGMCMYFGLTDGPVVGGADVGDDSWGDDWGAAVWASAG